MSNPKAPAPVPILIIIPFWSGDMGQATELCKILAALQGSHAGQTAHVMLVNRKDCRVDPNMVKIIAPKFNIHTYTSESNLKGWPAGPNGLFSTTMIRMTNYMKGRYEVVYWMEPDSTPLHPNWHHDLVKVWRARHPSTKVMGHRSDCNGDGTGDHVSGSCLYDPEIARIIPKITISSMAWDYEHRAAIVRVGQHTNCILSHYKATNCVQGTLDDMLSQGVAVTHGYKDNSLVNLVRAKYGIKG